MLPTVTTQIYKYLPTTLFIHPIQTSNSASPQLTVAKMEILVQIVVFIFFSMHAYFMHKALICCYTGALRELERASFFKSETPYATICFRV